MLSQPLTPTAGFNETSFLSFTERYEVVGPADPVLAVAGEDVILPCSVKSNISVVDLRVEWFRLDLKDSQLVHLYEDHEDRNTDQIESYRGRTRLNHQELHRGAASLKLSSVRVSDEGLYKCFIQSRSWYDDATVKVTVEAVGRPPVITVHGFDYSGGFRLECESKDWYPEPDLEWLDAKGVRLSPETTQRHRSTDRFGVKFTLIVHPRDSQIHCRVKTRRHSLETLIIIPSKMFHSWRTSVSLLSFVVVLGVTDVILIAVCVHKNRAHNRMEKEKRRLQQAHNILHHEKSHLHYEKTRLQYESDQLLRSLQAVTPTALTQLKTHSMDVILDADTAHPRLIVSDDGKQAREGKKRPEAAVGEKERFKDFRAVLGKEGFSSGSFYFQVQVKDQTKWYVGVSGESVISKGSTRLCSLNGFWTVSLYDGTYRARESSYVLLSLRGHPPRIGVFVDYEEGLISFYDVESSSHIYSFTDQCFNEKLYPFVCLGRYRNENSTPLIICDDY
ncbi:butyrophilin subfamily 1 member A1-like [Puntigrus tetrazona]|uniref:butyrophilin subfamily 1 member A1-like n=1 Tax=Puntigrus tetrazona TaxID=1606681 RepID=UPI001C8A0401|nr:butyrophilin subfamily 1 member A1-like [Puntigrus tetrazona]